MSKLSRFVSYGIEEGTEIPPFDAMVDDSVSDETAVAEAVEKKKAKLMKSLATLMKCLTLLNL